MIKENITVTVGGSYDLDGEIIVPSQVMTSNPQEESGDLTKTPNFVLKLVDEDKKIPINTYADVEFTLGDKTYTATMKAYNRAGNIIALQYVDGLTAEDISDDSSDDSSDEPAQGLHFSSPADGSTITGAIDYELQEFKYPIEVVGADGNNISYDITSMCVTCDNPDVGIGYTEDADENDQSYISGVYIYIYQAGTGTATLTFTDPESEDTCTTTFTYEVSEAVEPTLDKFLDVECSLQSNYLTMALPNDKNLQTNIYAAVYLVDPNTVVGERTLNEHYYTQVAISQDTYNLMQSTGETIEQLGWWGTKPYDDYIIVDDNTLSVLDSNGNSLGGCEDYNTNGIWRCDGLEAMQSTIFDVHGIILNLTDEGPYTMTFDLATPYIRVMRNGSPDSSGTFYGTVNGNGETDWSDYLIYPCYDDMYGGTYNASNGSDLLGQYWNGGTFVGQYVSGEPHGYPFMNNLGAFMLDQMMFEEQNPQAVLIEWRRQDPNDAPEYYEGIENEYPYKALYSQMYYFFLEESDVLEDYTLNDAPSQYSDISAYYDGKVTSDESNDVYMTTVGMTYDTDHYLFDANNQTDYVIRFWAPSDKTIDKITFVGLNEPYATAFVQQGTVGFGTITSDGNGNIIWTRTQDYNTYEGLEEFNFTNVIQSLGASMTCNEIIISLNPNYIPPEMKITFTTSQGTFQVWNNFTAGGGYGETVLYDSAVDDIGTNMIHGTWKYYIDDVEQDSSTYIIQGEVNNPFNDGGIYINSSTDNDGNVHSATGDIGYWGTQYYVTLDSNVTINYQMAIV